MKGKVVLLFGLISCLAVLAGYSVITYFDTETSEAKNTPETEGELREINGLEISLNEARVESVEEDPEHQFVIVDLTFNNVKETVHEFSSYNITLVDEEGFAHSIDTSIETKGIIGGQLHPGRSTRGELAFVVPNGEQFELVYTDHLRTGQVIWEVSVEK
ncbi:DUF4352 domain-containing protein [Halalkalibacter krulwichiae]|uniref:Telomeric repeat-binding factor 2 n=1 Tax=Halalkalibacter krulwichiae TaxID=199441 RepID=A0A1X9MBL1_9BACI|nr:DUF4352 domain-containing protein [Halalkalibacter krulwichiae]ARK30825.1 Telomeric repeat-binding factor 2 [Halalkalibacter krulwichiae]